MTKCIICDQRPSRNGNGLCNSCENDINRKRSSRQPAKAFRYITYQGHVVAMLSSGNGTLKPQLSNRKPEFLPKATTLDLNTYLEGFNRDTIKRLKALVLSTAHA